MAQDTGEPFDRCNILLVNLKKAIANASKRIEALNHFDSKDEFSEVIKESIIQTHEIAIELTWKTVKCFALRIEPSGQISGSTTAIKHGLSTGVIKEEKIARTLLEAIQHRNLSSHEYLLIDGIDDYVDRIRNEFQPAMIAFLSDLEVM